MTKEKAKRKLLHSEEMHKRRVRQRIRKADKPVKAGKYTPAIEDRKLVEGGRCACGARKANCGCDDKVGIEE